MSHDVTQCHDTVTCCDALLRLTGRGSFPVSRIFSSKRTILKMSFNPAHFQGLIRYTLPLRSCNTMSTDVVEGVEYFNTVVVQPHRKLVTNQGRGYHVRCRYQTQEKLLQNDFNVR